MLAVVENSSPSNALHNICVWHNVRVKPLRFTRSARRHKIGKTHAHHVISHYRPVVVTDPETDQATLTWIGADTRDRELEVVAVETDNCFLVIHVMPTALRTKGRRPNDP